MVCLVNPHAHTRYIETFSGGDAAAGTSHVNALPGNIGTGDRTIIAKTDRETGQTWPAGWTELSDAGNGGQACLAVAYRDCDGTEGGTTIDVTSANSRCDSWVGIKLPVGSFAAGSAPEVGTTATGNDANPNAPSISPSWGAVSTLVLAVFGGEANPGRTISGYPSGYSLYQKYGVGTVVGANGYSGMAGIVVAASSENPGTYTISGSDQWAAQTIAVKL